MVRVTETCLRAVHALEPQTCCFLTGFASDNGETILSCVKGSPQCQLPNPDWAQEVAELAGLLPSGVTLFGIATSLASEDTLPALQTALEKASVCFGGSSLLALAKDGDVVLFNGASNIAQYSPNYFTFHSW
jgi:hypothetical protein